LNLTHGSHSEAKTKADNEVVEMESEKEGNKRQMQQELDNIRTALREELTFNASAIERRKSTTGKKNK
jgi:F0F1-type ATP synthase membrane subunit b/b'